MRILDRYIIRSVLKIFLGCLLVFIFLYIISDIFSHLDDILKERIAIATLRHYYLAFIPIIFVQVTPFACLIATLYSIGTLNRNNELIAMRTAGQSIFQITKSIIIFGIVISAVVFWVNDRLLPYSTEITEEIKSEIESGSHKSQKEDQYLTNLAMYGLKNRLIFVNKFYPASNKVEGIIILQHDDKQNLTKKIVANKGVFRDGLWRFYQSITYNFDQNGQIINEPLYYEEEIIPIPETPKDFLNQRLRPDFMNIFQLEDYIWKLSKSGAITVIRNLKIDLYQKFTTPLTSLVIILLGIPFSVMMKKRATGLSSIGISIMVGFLYYVLNAVSIALGKAGILMPILSVSLSHLLALVASLYLIDKIS
ncbi:MAG: LPS export ABC transporter permease LptG [Candidatus Omnitrophota bacterium]|nr:MAG: LPS export ABC transporter permease LptG [Candidatus Omnitrophota bacterium]